MLNTIWFSAYININTAVSGGRPITMINWKTIEDDAARRAIQAGEFDPAIINSRSKVALILTQGWCPQWSALKQGLERIGRETAEEIDVYVYIYDRSPLFYDFLDFKEGKWGNDVIPYVRYYRDGALQAESNFISSDRFLIQFGD